MFLIISLFLILIKNLSIITNCVNVISKNDEKENDAQKNEKTRNIVYVFCFAYVLQLTLQIFLNFV